jgi:hypothetical protein
MILNKSSTRSGGTWIWNFSFTHLDFWKVKLITHFKEHFIIFYFGFHHQVNLVRELVLVSSDSNSLPITVVGIELWSSLPNSISITTEPPNDWCISLYFGFVKKCKFYFKVHHYLSLTLSHNVHHLLLLHLSLIIRFFWDFSFYKTPFKFSRTLNIFYHNIP